MGYAPRVVRAVASAVVVTHLLVGLAAACDEAAAPSAAPMDASLADALPVRADVDRPPEAQSVDLLWIGAHPDDEIYLAPLFAELCIEAKKRCRLLVLTRGEKGKCKRPEACTTDLATVRDGEMARSAALLTADLRQWDLGDGAGADPNAVLAAWAAKAGSAPALVAKMRAEIEAAAPSELYTFDPRHGSSCHPDHRAAAMLALVALEDLAATKRPAVAFAETTVAVDADAGHAGYVAAVPEDGAIVRVDATKVLAATGAPAWSTLVDVLRTHASQYTDAEIGAVARAPADQQATFFLRVETADAGDTRYETLCR